MSKVDVVQAQIELDAWLLKCVLLKIISDNFTINEKWNKMRADKF